MITFISSSCRHFDRISSRLENQSKQLVIVIGFFSIIIIAACDYVTGWELDLAYTYIFPIALVSWFVNQNAGILVACFCAVIWFISARLEGLRYSSDVITLWNISLRGVVLIAVATFVALVRSKFDSLSDAAKTDFLTGLPNGRAFYELAAREMEKAFGLEPLALAYIDIDGFKWINYRFGYATGDQMLCSIAQTIQ
jgi:GGDEF domain-containing protein